MEKARLITRALLLSRWCLIFCHIAFGGFVAFLVALAFEDDVVREYCIEVPTGKPYDFLWHTVSCRIDWSFFLIQFLGQIAVVYSVFIVPVWVLTFLLGRVKARSLR